PGQPAIDAHRPESSSQEILSATLWERCEVLAREADAIRAALGYAGRQAHEILPLGPGDLVVVDACDHNLSTGSTSPEGIAGWIAQGAHVYSYEGLHAKVLRFTSANGEATVVGSANVSAHSRDHLAEAAVLTSDPGVAEVVDVLIDNLVAEAVGPLDTQWVKRASKIYCPPSAERPRRRRQRVFPSNNHQLWVCGWVEDAGRIPADVEDELRAAELDHDSDVPMFVWTLGRGDELRVFDGDGVVLYELPPRT
ncbi:MAG: hypothetical protein ACRDTJ_21820, partial [Pseudonocardiaceae bacterium]